MIVEAPFFDPGNELAPQVQRVMADLHGINKLLNQLINGGTVDQAQSQQLHGRKDHLAAQLLRFYITGFTQDKLKVGIYKSMPEEEISPFSCNKLRLSYNNNAQGKPYETTITLSALVATKMFSDSVEIADALEGRYETLEEQPYDSLRRTHYELQVTRKKMQFVSPERMLDLRLTEGKLARRLLTLYKDPFNNGQLPDMHIYLITGKQKGLGFIFPDSPLGSFIINNIETIPEKLGSVLKQDIRTIGGYTGVTSRDDFIQLASSSAQNPPQTAS